MKVSLAVAYALHALYYMARHITELPVPTSTIAKAEGIPRSYLAKILGRLARAGLLRAVKSYRRGYVFTRSPEEISLLEVFRIIDGESVFSGCLLRYCECGGTPENCLIYSEWNDITKKMKELFARISLSNAAWNHPEHRFYELARSDKVVEGETDDKPSGWETEDL